MVSIVLQKNNSNIYLSVTNTSEGIPEEKIRKTWKFAAHTYIKRTKKITLNSYDL